MHPDEIGSEYPGKYEHIDCAENETLKTDPYKARESFKNGMVDLYPRRCPPWEESSNKAEYIGNLHTQYALPSV